MSNARPRQSLGKRLAKIFLPVLIAVNVPFLAVEADSLLNPIDLDKAGKGAMIGSQVFDYVLIPAILVILIIVQWLIILPMWNGFIKFRFVLFSSLTIGIVLSVLVGFLLGYLVCTKQSDFNELTNSVLLMSGFVTGYCIVNIITLYLLDKSYIKHLKSQKVRAK